MEHSEDEHHLDLVDSLMQSKSSSPDVNNLVVESGVVCRGSWAAELGDRSMEGCQPRLQ